MFFDNVDFLTDAFNDAITATAHTAALGASVATIFSLAADRRKDDGVEAPMKAVAKMSLLGTLL